MSGASGHQNTVSDTLELEHQEVVVYDMGIKPEFVFLRETIALNHWELSLIQGEKKCSFHWKNSRISWYENVFLVSPNCPSIPKKWFPLSNFV